MRTKLARKIIRIYCSRRSMRTKPAGWRIMRTKLARRMRSRI